MDRMWTFIDIGVHLTKLREGKITQAYMDQLIDAACPAPGACGMMGTANSMSLMVETIGMSLPGNATTSARSDHLLELAEQAGRQVVRLWENGITARKIINGGIRDKCHQGLHGRGRFCQHGDSHPGGRHGGGIGA